MMELCVYKWLESESSELDLSILQKLNIFLSCLFWVCAYLYLKVFGFVVSIKWLILCPSSEEHYQ